MYSQRVRTMLYRTYNTLVNDMALRAEVRMSAMGGKLPLGRLLEDACLEVVQQRYCEHLIAVAVGDV